MVLVYKGIETKIHIDARPYINEDIIIDSQGSIRYGFLKLNYAKMLQEWVKDIPQVTVNNTQIKSKKRIPSRYSLKSSRNRIRTLLEF